MTLLAKRKATECVRKVDISQHELVLMPDCFPGWAGVNTEVNRQFVINRNITQDGREADRDFECNRAIDGSGYRWEESATTASRFLSSLMTALPIRKYTSGTR